MFTRRKQCEELARIFHTLAIETHDKLKAARYRDLAHQYLAEAERIPAIPIALPPDTLRH